MFELIILENRLHFIVKNIFMISKRPSCIIIIIIQKHLITTEIKVSAKRENNNCEQDMRFTAFI